MNPLNADQFATNAVKVVNKNTMGGLDFDWEYLGAPGIPGILPGQTSDALNDLVFLNSGVMLASKSAVVKIFKVLDYIVHMSYDLHGQ
ncbi:hypothetical protein DBV05_g8732 [Lasiodiplodia theobromae]|uniref:GH18 domain-containing protein n=1 Tax=Lasiodiplodia theobromae TaxID=45133 RepID=A0A5N5D5K5_9PEZI|nr:hypothetical protein DBV05_g8732 [Lasiodiplodia theobromae]